MVDNRNTANELSDDELREIADEGMKWSANEPLDEQLFDLTGDAFATAYATGVIAERLCHRAEGEGRDGLAGSTFGLFYKLEEASRALRIGDCEGAEMYLEDARTLINGATRHGDGLARRLAAALDDLLDATLRGLDPISITGYSALLDEARAQGLLDEPTTHTTQPTTVPPIDVPALKVEHSALNEPHYWPWPNDQTARYELVHTVWRWLREQIGESREPATFTVINDEPAHPTTGDSAALGAMERLLIGERSRR